MSESTSFTSIGRGAEAPPVADEAGFETPGKLSSGQFSVENGRQPWAGKRSEQQVQAPFQGVCTPIANVTERAKRSETVGSSPTVTTTNPVGVQVQRLPDFFAYP